MRSYIGPSLLSAGAGCYIRVVFHEITFAQRKNTYGEPPSVMAGEAVSNSTCLGGATAELLRGIDITDLTLMTSRRGVDARFLNPWVNIK